MTEPTPPAEEPGAPPAGVNPPPLPGYGHAPPPAYYAYPPPAPVAYGYPPPYGYGYPPPTPAWNGFAIAGFVLSFFCGILGLIFSLIALSQVKKRRERGRGLAIAGVAISGVSLTYFIGALLINIAVVLSGNG